MTGFSSHDLYSQNKPYALAVIFVCCGYLLSSVSREHSPAVSPRTEVKWLADLRNLNLTDSRLVLPQDSDYSRVVKVSQSLIPLTSDLARLQVYNGECKNSPEAVVVVGSSGDVAELVRFVGEKSVELSVRSGGHSYSCTSSRTGGLQLDMRGLSAVQLEETDRSSTGWAVRLGPGATWEKVLAVLSPTQWTVVHGQCLGVGVGGFTLGGGVNMVGSTARYGAAMEQVIQYQLVTARGETITVDEEAVTFPEKLSDDDPRKGTDLLFGLRGAGASFGVVTEFLVRVYPVPETLASVIPVWVSSQADLLRLEAVARSEEGRGYQFGLYSLYYSKAVREPWLHPVLAASQHLLRLQAWWEDQPGLPLVLSVADIRPGTGRRTNTSQVTSLLQSAGVRLVFSSPALLDRVSQQAGALGMSDYEGEYLTASQRQSVGAQGLVSANMGGIESVASLSHDLLHHPLFGNENKVSSTSPVSPATDLISFSLQVRL